MTLPIAREAILQLIPHAAEMCLLDDIDFWDADSLRCRSRRFAQRSNPLRRADGRLGVACGVEIAGQAMAAHGRLLDAAPGTYPRIGMLVSLREVELAAGPVDAAELLIEVARLTGDSAGAAYRFSVANGSRMLIRGRAIVAFAAAS